jgi:hypothetical protein
VACLVLFLPAVLVIAGVRFRMPVEPFVVMVAGAGLARLARGWRRPSALLGLQRGSMGASR